jgi:LPXTG-motif cell wall-anchored protein
MFLTVNDGSNVRFVITTGGAGGEQRLVSSSGSLPLNQWSLVTVTLSGTTGKLYVGSQLVATNNNMTVHPSDFGQSTQNYLGKSQYASDPPFNGLLDDFNIYDRALSADEVLNLSTGVAGTGNVVKYSFDENTGASVPDSSGAARNGTIVNGESAGNGTNATTTSTDAQTADHFWTLAAVVDPGTGPGEPGGSGTSGSGSPSGAGGNASTGATGATPASAKLAATGADWSLLAMLGFLMLGAGVLVLRQKSKATLV